MKKITLLIVFLLSSVFGFSQTTVTIGTGTNASGTNDNGNPIYRSAATSVFNFSQSVQLLTATNLSSVGLTSGSTITKIAYFKTTAFTLSPGRTADLKIYLKNSGNTSLVTTQNMATWTSGATLGYSNTAVSATDIPAAAGWVEFNLTTPFNYTGGSIEVAIDFTGDTTAAGLTDGAFLWQYTTATSTQAVGTSNSVAITGNLTTAQSRLYNTQLTFTNSACSGIPTPGNTIASNTTPCAGDNVTFYPSTATIGSGVTYQWYNSTGQITGATSPNYVQSVSVADSFYCEVTCSGNTVATTPVSITPVVVNTFPYLENFTTFLPNCWQAADNGDLVAGPATFGSSSWVADGFGNNGTTGSIRYEIWLAAANDWIISPLINIPATGYELKFDAAVTQWNTTAPPTTPWESDDFVEVLVSTSFSNWTVLYTYNDANVPSTIGDINIIDLDAYAGQNVRFAFRVVEGTANGAADLNFYVDNFQIRQTPSCVEPILLTVDALSANSANLGWTESGTATAWEIEYGAPGFVNGTGTIIPASTNPFLLSGLTSNTSYEFYVRAVCSTSDLSTWTGPTTFKTLCDNVTDFVENFDSWPSSTTSLPDCWSKVGSGNVYITTGGAAPMSPLNRLYMNVGTTTTAHAVMRPVSNLQANTHRLRFKAYATTANKVLSVGYFTVPGNEASYVEIEPLQLPSTALANTQEFTIIPTSIPVGITQLVIKIDQTTPAATTVYIDDVKWEVNSSCVEPTALIASAISNSGATLGWTNGGSETIWDIQYGLNNFALGTGTTITGVTSNPYILSGLTSNTTYQFYVRGVCSGPTNSSWSGPYTFKTQCDDLTDYLETFDTYPSSTTSLPDCWSRGGNSTSTYITTGAVAPMSPSNRLYMFASGTATPPTEGYAILPAVSNLQAGTHRLKFKAFATAAGRPLEIGYLTDPSDVTTFIQLQEITLPSTVIANTQEFIIVPTGIPTGVKNLCIKNPGFPGGSTTAYIDDVAWELIPACSNPTNTSSSAVTSNQATIAWSSGPSATSWEIEYGPTGFTLGTGTVVPASTNPFTLTSLTPQTVYQYYVRSICAGPVTSSESLVGTFTTLCAPFTPYYAQDFATFPPSCWNRSDAGNPTTGPTGTGTGIWFADGFLNSGTTGAIKVNLYSNNRIGWMISPLFDLSAGGYRVKHDVAVTVWNGTGAITMGSDDVVSLLMSIDGGATWTTIEEYNATNSPVNSSNTEIYDISTVTSSSVLFAYYATDGTVDDAADYDFFIDNFVVETIPTCVEPTLVSASNITATSASFSWTQGSSNTNWEYVLQQQGTGMPTTNGTATSSNPLSVSSLTANTAYEFWIRTDCTVASNGFSIWVGPFNFSTACDATNVPYVMDFETATVPALPSCTSQENVGSGNLWAIANNPGYGFTTNALRYTYNTSSAANVWFYTQGINLVGGTTYAITFDYGSTGTTFPEKLKVAYGTSASAAAMTNPLADYPNVVNSTPLNSSVQFTPATSGIYYFGFNAYSTADQFYLLVDNINVDVFLNSNTFDNSSFVAYPNPVKDVLNLSYSSEISSVKVINLLGQEVISRKVGNSSTQIDMTSLTAGAYIVNVTVGDVTKTIKVIKQ